MDHAAAFPHKYLLNLSRRQDRRERCAELFESLGWDVKRQAAVDARLLKSARGFESPGRYAHALSTRMILRRAALGGAEAVLIMEDDIVMPPDVKERLAELELPADWAILYLGCQHHERPEVVSRGVVRVRAPLDTHAWAVRAPYFHEVRRALAGRYWKHPGPLPAADILLAELARRVPAYALYPNIAWQQEEVSDLLGSFTGNYNADGSVRAGLEVLPGLLAEALGGKSWPPAAEVARARTAWFWPEAECLPPVEPPPPPAPLESADRIAFLFLTRGEHKHAAVWDHYWRGQDARVSILAHTKEREGLRDGWLARAQISEHQPTEWGGLSLVQAELALLRASLADERNRFFILASESCIPVRPLEDLVLLLSTDGRSRFAHASLNQLRLTQPYKSQHLPPHSPVPRGQFRFHSQWVLLHREAAELVVENAALLAHLEGSFAPDEFAFGTILQIAGYPLESRVASRDVTWAHWPAPTAPHPRSYEWMTPPLAGEIMASGCYFARKFEPRAVPASGSPFSL